MNNTSFRDNAGFIFEQAGKIYRQINKCYEFEYEKLMSSGLYEALTDKKQLIPHKEVNLVKIRDMNFYKYIQPEMIKFITYPYEWSFSELKDAALLTLSIQKTALKYNMSLKDASAFNIQFQNGKPIFIDTLSFENYKEVAPWVAYGQFCRHFLAPLVLMSYRDTRLNKLFVTNIDGIPLDLCCKLLPIEAKLNPGVLFHIVIHGVSIKANEGKKSLNKHNNFSRLAMESLIDSLETCIKHLKLPKLKTEWGEYYNNTNYSSETLKIKSEIVQEFIKKSAPQTVCDLGANRGDFTRAAANSWGADYLAFDIDAAAVEENYKRVKLNKEKNILPLLLDLTNPTPAIGFAHNERADFLSRFRCDTVLALALIHHLAISNNLPFSNIADFFSKLGKFLIIEFVPKTDSKVQILLASREDIFADYTQKDFESEFSKFYTILEKRELYGSKRTLYLMRKK